MKQAPKIRHNMPRSSFDVYSTISPLLVGYAREVSEKFTADEFALPIDVLPPIPPKVGNHSIERIMDWCSPSKYRFFKYHSRDDEYEAMEHALHAYWATTNFILHGRQTFFIHENIVPLLASTHINVDASNFRLPAPACMFVFNDAESRAIGHAEQPENPMASSDCPISVTLLQVKSKIKDAAADIMILAEQSNDEGLHFYWKRVVPLRSGMTLHEALQNNYTDEEWAAGDEKLLEQTKNAEALSTEEFSDFQGKNFDFIRMIMNTALYLSSQGADLSPQIQAPKRGQYDTLPKLQRQRLESAAAQHSKLSYIYIGRNIEPLEIERDEIDGPMVGGHLTKRFKVRAHKRWQRVGPGLSEIKLTDVRSHWKGPEAAEVLHRRTVLKLHPDAMPDLNEDENVAEIPGSPSLNF